ncbi:hypothetical protein AGMMS49949_05250 [Alphaproteobacteria bacterium]|nr:hypothetical protein AGMMS49949_05250 [Alphaproteobacteria bacterium]GHS97434.1 hypothetical protein AGMMS50296_4410 [Alphaproteobacteria bacterium]
MKAVAFTYVVRALCDQIRAFVWQGALATVVLAALACEEEEETLSYPKNIEEKLRG